MVPSNQMDPYAAPGPEDAAPRPDWLGHAPTPAPAAPVAQPQFSYLDGFVSPGTLASAAPAMTAQHGTIGMPSTYAPAGQGMDWSSAAAAVPAPHPAVLGGGAAAATMPAAPAAPEQWAFPTHAGLQVVQPDVALSPLAPEAPTAVATAPASSVRRVRWEMFVPTLAAIGVLIVIAVIVLRFDEITGRDAFGPKAPAAAPSSATRQRAATPPAADRSTVTDAAAAAATKRANQRLIRAAMALQRQGRATKALSMLDAAIRTHPTPALQYARRTIAQRATAAAKVDAARAAAAAAATPRASTPPAAGGTGAAGGGDAAPPASSPPNAAPPKLPSIPNPVNTGGIGAAVPTADDSCAGHTSHTGGSAHHGC